MSDILTSGDFPTVRYLAGNAGTGIMPDAMLSSFAFLDYIESLVKSAIDDWATIKATASDDWIRLKTGTACLLAMRAIGRLEASLSAGVSFKIGDYSESQKAVEWKSVVSDLTQMAKEAFSSISTVTHTARTIIMVSGPTSSGYNIKTSAEQWIDEILPRVLDWFEETGEDDD